MAMKIGFVTVSLAALLMVGVVVAETATASEVAGEAVSGVDSGVEKTSSAAPMTKQALQQIDDTVIENILGRAPASVGTRTGGNNIPRKRYPGGRDEDDLQVQSELPTPSRGLEAAETAAGHEGD
ncbi:MAG: hypothetical protein RBT63_08765 [Bdellovibrionales bacterium]|jgi:hypothetical protein|nr:hypothetical protein [Bdellovibrionales bacterium]